MSDTNTYYYTSNIVQRLSCAFSVIYFPFKIWNWLFAP